MHLYMQVCRFMSVCFACVYMAPFVCASSPVTGGKLCHTCSKFCPSCDWPNLPACSGEPRAIIQATSTHSQPLIQQEQTGEPSMKVGRLSAGPFVLTTLWSRIWMCVCVCVCRGPDQGDKLASKPREEAKGLRCGQQEHWGLHSLTWWGFWSMVPPRWSLSDCVGFSSVFLKSAGRKVAPSRPQQVRGSSGRWPRAIARAQICLSSFT